MGRLFWKFFAFVWLAQIAGIIAVVSFFWLNDRRTEAAFNDIAAGPMVDIQVGAAAEVLRYAGAEAFRNWSERQRGATVFAVDTAGRDVLGRLVPLAVAAEIRQLPKDRPESPGIREVQAADGHRYTLFAVGHGADRPGGALTRPHALRYGLRIPPVPLVATLAASILTALLLAGYVAKPIRSLRAAFEAAASGDLDRRIAPQLGARHDELADLGRDFDRMAARLKASMQGQRRLLHDVSHELRSPLARLQAAAGLIRQNPDQLEAMIIRIEEEIARIDHFVGELLTLSRIEAGDLVAADEEVDMRDLVRDIIQDANFEAQAHEREVVWDDRGSATVQGRPELLHSAIENIVRNALKHAPESRIVRVETSVDADKRQYTLHVLDDGRGVPEDELPDLFTPFFRGARARPDGYGLGLAIARRSIEAYGGTIRANNRSGGGLSVEIVLPWRG
ncbi:MAG: two-component system, OmpR family, sensor kinase [Gammaproteobacteria bacterium]|jgi:two-component system OmpR family sensor kinase|nr:two-component system, OmpR family, sensor kinase [Gammaproteobacteria bacterium]